MPLRNIPLVEGEIYHLFNRGVEHRPIFSDTRDYRRFTQTVEFYRFLLPPVRLSLFLEMSGEKRSEFWKQLERDKKKQVEIFCYCLMPNHFHLVVRQLEEGGISNFLRLVQNSYVKYFNLKYKRVGPLLQGQFKAIRIETDEQLLHVSRYIHLNPYSSFLVKSLEALKKYPWSSLPDYLEGKSKQFLNKEFILGFFSTLGDYQKFVFDQADYQRELDRIKHLTFED